MDPKGKSMESTVCVAKNRQKSMQESVQVVITWGLVFIDGF
jgi:hypothetical protein